MAAIEKICEFSDEYPNCPVYGGGWIMRKWSTELDAFRSWKQAQTPAHQAEMDRLPSLDESRADHAVR